MSEIKNALNEFQIETCTWANSNFPDAKPYMPALGVSEEIQELVEGCLNLLGLEVILGRLHHSHLKMEQNIRKGENHREKIADAVGDIIVFLCDYCSRNGFKIGDCVADTWDEVKRRDWQIDKVNGGVSDSLERQK